MRLSRLLHPLPTCVWFSAQQDTAPWAGVSLPFFAKSINSQFPNYKATWQGTRFLLLQCFVIQTQCVWHPRMKYNSGTFGAFCSKGLTLTYRTSKKGTFGNKSSLSERFAVKPLFLFHLETLWGHRRQSGNPRQSRTRQQLRWVNCEKGRLPAAPWTFCLCHTLYTTKCQLSISQSVVESLAM